MSVPRIRKPRVTVDKHARAIYIDIDGGKRNTLVSRTVEVAPGINIDFGWLNQPVGIELLLSSDKREIEPPDWVIRF